MGSLCINEYYVVVLCREFPINLVEKEKPRQVKEGKINKSEKRERRLSSFSIIELLISSYVSTRDNFNTCARSRMDSDRQALYLKNPNFCLGASILECLRKVCLTLLHLPQFRNHPAHQILHHQIRDTPHALKGRGLLGTALDLCICAFVPTGVSSPLQNINCRIYISIY